MYFVLLYSGHWCSCHSSCYSLCCAFMCSSETLYINHVSSFCKLDPLPSALHTYAGHFVLDNLIRHPSHPASLNTLFPTLGESFLGCPFQIQTSQPRVHTLNPPPLLGFHTLGYYVPALIMPGPGTRSRGQSLCPRAH